ncbi:MAG: MBL fold metallo-hydrolase [Myxococcales bacterium]|nr:MBL fold metallo-hydrolase [Myxococcales bacterium]
MAQIPFDKGLHELGNGTYAYLQPDGSWGFSNAGLIADGDRSLLVDTLFDLKLTRQMLEAMQAVTRARPIRTLVNTHSNGDPCGGNQLVEEAEIVASRACAEEMKELDPAVLAALMKADGLGELGEYLTSCFGSFDFEGITLTPPTRTFDGELSLHVGARQVQLIEVGPAHTRGDVLALVPNARTVFTGDILFIDGTPIVWAGPLSNWVAACDRILAMDVETVVPGHGPVTDKDGVRQVRDYLSYVDAEATKRHEVGMGVEEAARDIALGQFSTWGERERIAVNVHTKYRELDGDSTPGNAVELFTLMSKLA